MARSNMTREEVKARIAAQMTLEEKKAYASLVIDNSGTFAETEKAVAAAWKIYGGGISWQAEKEKIYRQMVGKILNGCCRHFSHR